MRRASIVALALLATAGAGWAALAWRPAIAPIAAPARTGFDAGRIERGARLAAVGNCSGCHSAADRPPYAGGVAVGTPFGTIYGSNLTPDERTGVGTWSEAAFTRAMREGVDRAGRQLYPAFPYDHYARSSDDDLRALYAFVMTRTPVHAEVPAPALRFPLGFRPLVAGWKLLFFDPAPFRPEPARSAEWNRGAYLAQSLGHCSACHTPRNALGAERRGHSFDGGEAEGWYAPALNAASPSPLPWTVDAMTGYLRSGLTPDHAIAGGPMQQVVAQLGRAEPADVRAIAVYVVALMGAPSADDTARAAASRRRAEQPLARLAPAAPASGPATTAADGDALTMQLGATVYADACAACHDRGREPTSGSALRLPLAVAVHDPDPRSLLRIVREGVVPADGDRGRWMPAFGSTLSDAQLTALAAYLRRHAAGAPPWLELERAVKESRS